MKYIKEYLNEQFNPEWDYVVEMANIGYPILNKIEYNVSVHGLNSGERIRPHFHIYYSNDNRPFLKFNFEIALDELVCYNELNIIRMKDKSKDIDYTNRNKCSWSGYSKLKNDFEDWLYSKAEKPGNFINNLDAIIYFYNSESGNPNKSNYLLDYIKDKGMKIHNNFVKYFSQEDKDKYKECFFNMKLV